MDCQPFRLIDICLEECSRGELVADKATIEAGIKLANEKLKYAKSKDLRELFSRITPVAHKYVDYHSEQITYNFYAMGAAISNIQTTLNKLDRVKPFKPNAKVRRTIDLA